MEAIEILVAIDAIDADLKPASQMRLRLDEEAIEDYAVSIDAMPPVRLVFDEVSNIYWVVDGAHTISAAKALERDEIAATVEPGNYLDAFREASRCNATHGVPIRAADKKRRVEVALEHPVMGTWTQAQIAEACNCSFQYVSRIDKRDFNSGKPHPPKNSPLGGRPRKDRSPEPQPSSNGHANGSVQQHTPRSGQGKLPVDKESAPEEIPPPDEKADAIAKAKRRAEEDAEEDRAAARWNKLTQDYCVLIGGFKEHGGPKVIARGWKRRRLEAMVNWLTEIARDADALRVEFEEMLK